MSEEINHNVTLVNYQLCPKCNGQGVVSEPPYTMIDIHGESSAEPTSAFICNICKGEKIIPLFPINPPQ